jgi:hypothetical protein
MSVTIESAGSHAFDLDHIRRQGGEELIRRLLNEANLSTDLPWRLQVQKKLNCNSETPPARVVAAPKKWAVYLKIKPGDNNSCHFCSLLMPPGLQGEAVYAALRKASLDLDRNWRLKSVDTFGAPLPEQAPASVNHLPGLEEPVEAPEESAPQEEVAEESFVPEPERPEPVAYAAPAATAATAAANAAAAAANAAAIAAASKASGGTGKGWLQDPEKTRLLLLTIREIDRDGPFPQDRFAELLAERLGWTNATRYEVGGIFTALVRKNLIVRKFRGSRPFGYELSQEGHQLLKELTPDAPPPSPVAAAPPAVDPFELIRSFGSIAKRFLDANARLEQIEARERELTEEMEMLRDERAEISAFLEDPAVRKVLSNLGQMNLVKH